MIIWSDDDDDDVVTPRSTEAWAMMCALKVERDHGSLGPVYIAEMLGKFALEGNEGGIETWKAIAQAYEQLIRPSGGLN